MSSSKLLITLIWKLSPFLPVIREPTTPPPARVAERVTPSGDTSALAMVRSVTGPMAAYVVLASKRNEERVDKEKGCDRYMTSSKIVEKASAKNAETKQ